LLPGAESAKISIHFLILTLLRHFMLIDRASHVPSAWSEVSRVRACQDDTCHGESFARDAFHFALISTLT
ncbi:MAG: hypothetical protein V3R26_07070, partial [Hyphomicrobium sp.]